MRSLFTTLALLLACACAGNSPAAVDSGRACERKLYDRCQQEHDCETNDCRNFVAGGFQVCSKSCVVGDDASCGATVDGRPAVCTAGICTPPGPNDCVLR